MSKYVLKLLESYNERERKLRYFGIIWSTRPK